MNWYSKATPQEHEEARAVASAFDELFTKLLGPDWFEKVAGIDKKASPTLQILMKYKDNS